MKSKLTPERAKELETLLTDPKDKYSMRRLGPGQTRIGDPCTLYVGSDRYPYEVSKVSPSGKTIEIRQLHWSDETKSEVFRWNAKRKAYYRSYSTVVVGRALHYMDPSF